MKYSTLSVLLAITSSAVLLTCSDSVMPVQPTGVPFRIRVDSLVVPQAACTGESLSIQVWAKVGPNSCYRFHHLETSQTGTMLRVTLWGEHIPDAGCAGDTVRLQGQILKVLPTSPGLVRIQIYQPDSTILTAQVDVRNALSPLGTEPVTIATLVVNYQTHVFEGASIATYPPCRYCNCISMPFVVGQLFMGDFGDITFRYAPNNQEFFHASIVWHGQGSIQFPAYLTPADSFTSFADSLPQPQFAGRWSSPYGPSAENRLYTDSAWSAVCRLDLLRQFDPTSLRVGFYGYPPTIGAFNPQVAKWIIFACGIRRQT